MNNNLTEVVVIADRSGSMERILNDAIGGFNSFLKKQKEEPGECKFTVVLFDNYIETPYEGVDIQNMPELTKETYYTRGSTALNDAIGLTIGKVGQRLASTPEDEKPGKVIFVIITDGEENASREFGGEAGRARIKAMIEEQKTKYSWTFVFLAANQDAFLAAGGYGISQDNAMQFAANGQSQNHAYMNVSSMVSRTRSMDSVMYSASLDNAFTSDEKDATK